MEPDKQKECLHESFETHSKYGRLTDTEGGPVTSFVFECKVKCTQCGQFFEFIGVPGGTSKSQPTSSYDFTELRAPIRPFTNTVQDELTYEFGKPKQTGKKDLN